MDNYIKTIINGLKTWGTIRLNHLEENLGKKINATKYTADAAKRTADAAKSTADTAKNTADTAKNTADAVRSNMVSRVNPAVTGSFSQNRKEGTTVGGVSHAEGQSTTASGYASHAEGQNTTASGYASHAEGQGTTASGYASHVQGRSNVEDTLDKYAHIVGNGFDDNSRSNAHTLDWKGVGWFAGGLKVGGTGQDDEAAVDVALKTDIPNTAPVVFTEDGNGGLVNADGDPPTAEEVYNALLAGSVYIKSENLYFPPAGFFMQDGTLVLTVSNFTTGENTTYEVSS